jgi:hypothetical protein
MEFDHLGKRCYMCHQQDFLPIECDLCNKFFCLEHSSIDSHQCPNFNSENDIEKKQKSKKKKKDKHDVIHKYLQKKDTYEPQITIQDGKIKFSNDRLVPDDKNYHTYTDIPLNSEDEMSESELKENENNTEKKSKENNKLDQDNVSNTCGDCMVCSIM